MSSTFSCSSDAAGSAAGSIDKNGVERACNFHVSFANSKLQTETACGTRSRATRTPHINKDYNHIAINVMHPGHGSRVSHTKLEAGLLESKTANSVRAVKSRALVHEMGGLRCGSNLQA
jgi:hypothetical protein